MENTFKRNLSVITGNDSLVKLDVVDPVAETKRINLARNYGYEENEFDAALFIYFCNVLDEADEYKNVVNRKDTIARKAKALVDYFQDIQVLGQPKCSMSTYIADYDQVAVLSKVDADMDRLYKVWHELTLES